jgi:hypothetical protein
MLWFSFHFSFFVPLCSSHKITQFLKNIKIRKNLYLKFHTQKATVLNTCKYRIPSVEKMSVSICWACYTRLDVRHGLLLCQLLTTWSPYSNKENETCQQPFQLQSFLTKQNTNSAWLWKDRHIATCMCCRSRLIFILYPMQNMMLNF